MNCTSFGVHYNRAGTSLGWYNECLLHDNTDDGISFGREDSAQITNCFIYSNGGKGIRAGGTNVVSMRIIGNAIYSNGAEGIESSGGVHDANDCIIIGNIIRNNTGTSIALDGTGHVIVGNVFEGNGTDAPSATGVIIGNNVGNTATYLDHDDLGSVTSDQHHAQLHAATHAENQADEIVAEGLGATSVDVSTNLKPDGTGGVEFVDSDHADLANVTSDQHHPQTHTVVSHDTTATGANLTALTNDSDAGTLHNHDGDIATHAAIATAHHTKYTDAEVDTIVATHAAISSAHHVAGGGGVAAFSEFLLIGA